jgi:hypothetical protein
MCLHRRPEQEQDQSCVLAVNCGLTQSNDHKLKSEIASQPTAEISSHYLEHLGFPMTRSPDHPIASTSEMLCLS